MNDITIKREYGAYFTVEAALILPTVLGCYYLIILLLCFSYERSVWEQNAYRLPVWKEYVEGFAGMDPGAEEFPEAAVCRYVLASLENTEEKKYIFGQGRTAQISIKGEFVTVQREMEYMQFQDSAYEMKVTGVCLEPVEYIRMVNLLKEKISKDKGEEDD